MKNISSYLLLLLLVPLVLKGQQGIQVGSKINNFNMIEVNSGAQKSLSDFASSKGVVLIFHSITCPFAKMYEPKLKSMVQEFQSRGIAFIFIDSPNGSESATDIKKYMVEHQLGYINYWLDTDRKLTTLLGVSKVPEVFLLKNVNGSSMLFYKGAIDNNPSAKDIPSETYLQDAIKALLSQTPLKVTSKSPSGCAIEDY